MDLSIKFLGHATFHVQAGEDSIVIDPFLAPSNPACPVTQEELEANYILVTHGHHDHVSDLKDLARRTGAKVVSNYEICDWLSRDGITNVHAMHIGGSHIFSFGTLKLTAAVHGSLLPDGSCGGAATGLLLHFRNDRVVYHAGDTGLTYDMRLIGEKTSVDLALLPIGDNFTMGPEDAVVAAQFVNAEKVVPMHYNTFPLVDQDPDKFAELLKAEGIDCEIMNPGEELTL